MNSHLNLQQSYTFSNYFDLNLETEDVLAAFGYTFARIALELPQSDANFSDLDQLSLGIQRRLPFVSLSSEIARREILIAPLLLTLIDYTQAQLRIEYPLNVSEQLKGSLDYYLHNQHSFLVIAAKKADLARGFTQLAVELIALERWLNLEEPRLYGAVSTGDIWQFGCLHIKNKHIEQDINLFRVPADLKSLFPLLVGILNNARV